MANFFIIGLPRSRTAWLANFLTTDHRFCHHEGINGCSSIEQYREKIGSNDGDSGTGMMLFDMNTLFPDSPIVIIERDPNAAIEFCYRTYGHYDPEAMHFLKERLDKIEGLRIRYEEINIRLADIWAHVVGSPFNQRRADMLIKMNVQIIDPFDIDHMAAEKLFSDYRLPEN